jgi:hypothetical protein
MIHKLSLSGIYSNPRTIQFDGKEYEYKHHYEFVERKIQEPFFTFGCSQLVIFTDRKRCIKLSIFSPQAKAESIRKIFRIHEILHAHGLAPKPISWIVVEIEPPKDPPNITGNVLKWLTHPRFKYIPIGYGLIVERLYPAKDQVFDKEKFAEHALRVCRENRIKRFHEGHFRREILKKHNYIVTQSGPKIIDIDNAWQFIK